MQALGSTKGASFFVCIPRPPACQCMLKQRPLRRHLRTSGRFSGHTKGTWPSRSCKGRSATHVACKAAHVGADGAAAGPRKTVEGASEDIGVIWSRLVKVHLLAFDTHLMQHVTSQQLEPALQQLYSATLRCTPGMLQKHSYYFVELEADGLLCM